MPNEPNIPGLRRAFRLPGSAVQREVDEEIAFHLESRTRELIAAGASPEEARRTAEAEFGDLGASRHELASVDRRRLRRAALSDWIETTAQDVRYAFRVLRRSPGYAATVIACVAIGVGLTTTIVSAVNAILVRPLPFPNADRLVTIYAQSPRQGYLRSNISYFDFTDWRARSRAFDDIGIWTWRNYGLSSGSGDAERVQGSVVSANLFPLLGVRPMLGRSFLSEEERPGNDRVVILSHQLWARRYGADSAVIGRMIAVNEQSYRVVGIMPPGFAFPNRGEMWTPFAVDLAQEQRDSRGYAAAIGRLRKGYSFDQGATDLARVSAALARDFPASNIDWAAEPIPLKQDLVGSFRRPLFVFLGGVCLVLLIVCANVANLSLARGIARTRELSVRVAIGANRGRILRQLLTETLVLTLVGGLLGFGLASFGVKGLRRAFPDGTPFYINFDLDWVALSVALLLSVGTGVLFGVIPALASRQSDLGSSLRDGSRGSGTGSGRARMRSALVMAEVALSVMLMIGAGLLVRSYARLASQDLGFDERNALTFQLALPRETYPYRPSRLAFYDNLIQGLKAIPGAKAVGIAQGIPFSGMNWEGAMMVDGEAPRKEANRIVAHYQWVSPEFFDALGVKLVAGRPFNVADRDTNNVPGIVNETFAKRFFNGASPLGRRVRLGDTEPWVTIVGVIKDYQHYTLPQPMGPAIYYPYATHPLAAEAVVIRTSQANAASLLPAARAAVRAMDPNVPLFRIRTLEDQVSVSMWRQRLQGQVLGLFAVVALALALIGMYGVISYSVTQRHHELGVRLALGATPRQVLGLVFRQGMALTGISAGIGILGAAYFARWLTGLLYEIDLLDPLTFVAVPAFLVIAAMVATFIPARRASRVNPLKAIRAD